MIQIIFSGETLEEVGGEISAWAKRLAPGTPIVNTAPIAADEPEPVKKRGPRKSKDVADATPATPATPEAPPTDVVELVAIDYDLVKARLTELSAKKGSKVAIDLLQSHTGAVRVSAIPLEKLESFYNAIEKALA